MPSGLLSLDAEDPRPAMVRRGLAAAVGLRRPVPRPVVSAIEERRRALQRSSVLVDTHLPHQPTSRLPLGTVVDRVGKRRTWSRFLAGLAHASRAATIVELGASVGLTTAWLAAAAPGARVATVEGVPAIAAIARETVSLVPTADVTVHVGRFKDVLPGVLDELHGVDLAFVDGDHEGGPTIEYLELLRPLLGPTSMVVFDDIRWSPGMASAWREITERADTGLRVDLRRLGVWGPATATSSHDHPR